MTDSGAGPVDLLVLGGGMAGLSAAARAVQEGASVVLSEKGPAIGGSAAYAGFIWTAPTVDVMREVNPNADADLAASVADGYTEALEWARSLEVEVADPVTVLGYGRGCRTDTANFLLACERLVRDQGEPFVNAQADSLIVEDGRVCGAEVRLASGESRIIRARSTAGNRRLRRRRGPSPRAHPPRSPATSQRGRTSSAAVTASAWACRQGPASGSPAQASMAT